MPINIDQKKIFLFSLLLFYRFENIAITIVFHNPLTTLQFCASRTVVEGREGGIRW
jgi:hypothetical protein